MGSGHLRSRVNKGHSTVGPTGHKLPVSQKSVISVGFQKSRGEGPHSVSVEN